MYSLHALLQSTGEYYMAKYNTEQLSHQGPSIINELVNQMKSGDISITVICICEWMRFTLKLIRLWWNMKVSFQYEDNISSYRDSCYRYWTNLELFCVRQSFLCNSNAHTVKKASLSWNALLSDQWFWSSLIQKLASHSTGTKSLFEPVMTFHQSDI